MTIQAEPLNLRVTGAYCVLPTRGGEVSLDREKSIQREHNAETRQSYKHTRGLQECKAEMSFLVLVFLSHPGASLDAGTKCSSLRLILFILVDLAPTSELDIVKL